MTGRLVPIGARDGANTAVRWGFTRPIGLSDWMGEWFSVANGRAVVWVESCSAPNTYPVHLVVRPDVRRTGWPLKKAFAELVEDVMPRSHPQGGALVVFHDPGGPIEPYLERLGFQLKGLWWVKEFPTWAPRTTH